MKKLTGNVGGTVKSHLKSIGEYEGVKVDE